MKIAIIAQDGMKVDIRTFALSHKTLLLNHTIISTEGTAKCIKNIGIDVTAVASGQEGGDVNIADMVLRDEIDAVIFLLNPTKHFSHECDSHALIRVCNLKNVIFAGNLQTADAILKSIR
ncbi:MAG TPA: methylglyoxal synthase [Methanosarcinaceae archaeon]|nr:methylglyoxal synthase [Methanosarcinaceae archaeon]